MRVSTSMIYDSGRQGMQRQSADLLHTQQQLSTGRRILRPSDDPVAAARALEVGHSRSANTQYLENQGYAKDSLRQVEGALSAVSDLVTHVRTRVLEAGNAGFSQSDLDAIATDLKSQYEHLRGLANTRDGEGQYLFGGFQVDREPFPSLPADPADPVQSRITAYQGDEGQRSLQVGSARQMPVSAPGSHIFGDGATGIFAELRTFIADLESGAVRTGKEIDPGPPPVMQTGPEILDQALGSMDAMLDRVLAQRAAAGARLGELDALGSVSTDYDLQYAETLSRLQDLDYAEAISRFSKEQTILQAAQQSYVKVTGLSLFNLLR